MRYWKTEACGLETLLWKEAAHGGSSAVCSRKNKKTGKEWLDCGKDADWLCARKEKDAFFHEAFLSGKPRSLRMEAGSDDDCGIGREHLKAAVVLEYADCQLRWIHRIYPQTAVLRSCLQVVAEGMAWE